MSKMETTAQYVLQPKEFDRIRQMAYEFCGVDLCGKEILIGARLGKKVRQLGLSTFTAYCDRVAADKSGELFTEMIDALTTNHTSFFREVRHFEFLVNQILPRLAASSKIAVWSAACSSGEEPYSIALSVIEALGEQAYKRLSITATDISTKVLSKGRQGLYQLSSLASVSLEMRRACLMKGTGEYADKCLVKPALKNLVDFQQLNLLQDCSSVGPFQVIFCRNVMIYFDQATQQTVVDHLAARLVPGGYLFIGHAESLNGISHSLDFIGSAIYRKPQGAAPAATTGHRRSARGLTR